MGSEIISIVRKELKSGVAIDICSVHRNRDVLGSKENYTVVGGCNELQCIVTTGRAS